MPPRLLKTSPIWSHWAQAYQLTLRIDKVYNKVCFVQSFFVNTQWGHYNRLLGIQYKNKTSFSCFERNTVLIVKAFYNIIYDQVSFVNHCSKCFVESSDHKVKFPTLYWGCGSVVKGSDSTQQVVGSSHLGWLNL